MSLEVTIWNALVATLKAAQAPGQPLEFVKNVIEGSGGQVTDQSYPAIILEPDNEDESSFTIGSPGEILAPFRITVSCALIATSPALQIVGTPEQPGILDFVAAVKNVISADRKLGVPEVGFLKFNGTRFFYQNFPMRQADITVEVPFIAAWNGR